MCRIICILCFWLGAHSRSIADEDVALQPLAEVLLALNPIVQSRPIKTAARELAVNNDPRMTTMSTIDEEEMLEDMLQAEETPYSKQGGSESSETLESIKEKVFDKGNDFTVLKEALAAGKFEEADEIQRQLLVELSGEAAKARGWVYFTEVPNIPVEDMKAMDDLWKEHSDKKFGYSIQKQKWLKAKSQWTPFFREIDWVTGESDEYRRWTALGQNGNTFIYDAKEAKAGHLPLTSALRGTQLLEAIFAHPAFDDVQLRKAGAPPSSGAKSLF